MTDSRNRYSVSDSLDPFAILSLVVPLSVYLLTLAPSVTFYDSGEFLTAISSLGFPHSPGYPLFVNYAKPFTWLPFGDIAFRVNFATAVSAALACLGVYLLTVRLLKGVRPEAGPDPGGLLQRISALCAAFAFAFSPRLWLQSNHDKPYPLLAFLAALVFLLVLRWRDAYRQGREHPGLVYLGAFICGLAMGAHQTMVLLLPSFAFLILATDWRLIARIKEQILAGAFFIFGVSVYLYLPVRAMRSPLLNWGDPKTLSQFLWTFLRKGYPMVHVDRDVPLLFKQLAAFDPVHEFTIGGFVLLLVGAVALCRRDKAFVIAFVIAVATFLAFVVGYQNTPEETIFLTEEFFTPLYLLSAVLIGIGMQSLVCRCARLAGVPDKGRMVAGAAMFIMAALLPGYQVAANYRANDQHDNYLAYDYAMNTFRSLPEGAVLFTWGDSGAFPLWYVHGVERMREDLVLLHVPHLQFRWYLDSMPAVFRNSVLQGIAPEKLPLDRVLLFAIKEQLAIRPVFIDFSTRYSVETPGLSLRQRGICYGIREGEAQSPALPDISVWNEYRLRGVAAGTVPFLDLDSLKALQIYSYSRLEAGKNLLSRGKMREGAVELRWAMTISPEMRFEVHRILSGTGATK